MGVDMFPVMTTRGGGYVQGMEGGGMSGGRGGYTMGPGKPEENSYICSSTNEYDLVLAFKEATH